MASTFNTIPTKEEYMKMIRKNIGIFNNRVKGKGFKDTSSYSYLKTAMHIEMMRCIHETQDANPCIVYSAKLISMLAEQRLIRTLEQKGYKVVSGYVPNGLGRMRYITALVDWERNDE